MNCTILRRARSYMSLDAVHLKRRVIICKLFGMVIYVVSMRTKIVRGVRLVAS